MKKIQITIGLEFRESQAGLLVSYYGEWGGSRRGGSLRFFRGFRKLAMRTAGRITE